MNQHFKHAKKGKQHEITHKNPGFQIIDMCKRFPFGEFHTNLGEGTEILVRKKLSFIYKGQQQIINRTECLMKGLKNNFLINFHHMQKEETHVYFYFEYVHLNIEKWVLDLGDKMWEILKNQMLELATFLNKNHIFWTFEEKCLGLNKNISVKYFLDQFSLIQPRQKIMKSKNLTYNREKIEKYFTKFKKNYQEQSSVNYFTSMILQTNKKCVDDESLLCSITTRESWTLPAPKTSRIQQGYRSRSKLNEKIAQSKAKITQILQKLKKFKNLQF